MKNITVRSFAITDVPNFQDYSHLPVMFTGTEKKCRKFCESIPGYEWRKDSNIFGGYYARLSDGHCLILY